MRVNNLENKTATHNKSTIKIKAQHLGSNKLFLQQQYCMIQDNSLSSLHHPENHDKLLLPRQLETITKSRKEQQNLDVQPSCKVPIYSLTTFTSKFQVALKSDSMFGWGTLMGKFYENEGNVKIENVMFVGNFKGSLEVVGDELYFEGNISQLIIILRRKEDLVEDLVTQKLAHDETSFRGFFKGKFYQWSIINEHLQSKKIQLIKQSVSQISDNLNLKNYKLTNVTDKVTKIYQKQLEMLHTKQVEENTKQVEEKADKKQKDKKMEYYVPWVVSFDVQDVRQINLEKSMAVVSGYLHVQIHYNDEINEFIKHTFAYKKQKERWHKLNKTKDYESESLLKIVIQFNRDFSLALPIEELQDDFLENEAVEGSDDDDQKSSGSQWSIQDKTWDIEVDRDQKQKIIKFKIWKRFNAQIDNSYGAFFAPFNLSVLRIVVTANSFNLMNLQNQKVKVNLSGTDVQDFQVTNVSNLKDLVSNYDPFKPCSGLVSSSDSQNMMMNRIHKINKKEGKDNGIYIIADNRLTCYPHYKNILINKSTSNDDPTWGMGMTNKKALLQAPKVQKISELYKRFDQSRHHQKYTPFSFRKWNYFVIEIPIFKYIVIEMLQIFVPLILLSVISLLIFNQANGISNSSGYTTLSLRIVNVCSLMIAYVSLIPTLRENLPPMPTITLIQIITYVQTLPNLLALINSMVYYTISLTDWESSYQNFRDGIFLFSFITTLLSLLVLILVFMTYAMRQYNFRIPKLPRIKQKPTLIKYHSPHYVNFMQEIRACRPEYRIQKHK